MGRYLWIGKETPYVDEKDLNHDNHADEGFPSDFLSEGPDYEEDYLIVVDYDESGRCATDFNQLQYLINGVHNIEKGEANAYIVEGSGEIAFSVNGSQMLENAKVERQLTDEEIGKIKESIEDILQKNYWKISDDNEKTDHPATDSCRSVSFNGKSYSERITDKIIGVEITEEDAIRRLTTNVQPSEKQAVERMFKAKFKEGKTNVSDMKFDYMSCEINKVIVHAGPFHADDVLCVAMLRQINPDIEIIRTNKVPKQIEDGTIVADIGGGKYDHHQPDPLLRDDGMKHSACGLIFEDYKSRLFFESSASIKPAFDLCSTLSHSIVSMDLETIEDRDNGVPGSETLLGDIVNFMKPEWDEDISMDEAFMNAVDLVQEHYVKHIATRSDFPYLEYKYLQDLKEKLFDKHQDAVERAETIVKGALEKSNGLVVNLDRGMPWQKTLCPTTAKFVVYPSLRGGYGLQCVPVEPASKQKKIEIPKKWLTEKPEGCDFVHPALFYAQFQTREQANKEACELCQISPEIEPRERRMTGEDIDSEIAIKQAKEEAIAMREFVKNNETLAYALSGRHMFNVIFNSEIRIDTETIRKRQEELSKKFGFVFDDASGKQSEKIDSGIER